MEQNIKEEEIIIDPELECAICSDIMFTPVSINCGHSFCKSCLVKSLKIKPECPLCKTPLLIQEKSLKENITLRNIIENKYPAYIKKRAAQSQPEESIIQEEFKDEDVPINPLLILPLVKPEDALFFPGTKMRIEVRMEINETILFHLATDRKFLSVPDSVTQTGLPCVTAMLQMNKLERKNNQNIYWVEVDVLDRVHLERVNNLDLDQRYLESIEQATDQPLTVKLGYGCLMKDKPIGTVEQIKDQVETIEEMLNTRISNLMTFSPFQAQALVNLMAPLLRDSQIRNMSYFIKFSLGLAKVIKATPEEKRRMVETTNTLERLLLLKSILDKHEHESEIYNLFEVEGHGSGILANPKKSTYLVLALLLLAWLFKVFKKF